MLRRHAAAAALALQKVILRLRDGKDRVMTPEGQHQEVPVAALHPEEMSAGDLARLADVALRIDRLARGLPTEHAQVTGKVRRDADAIVRLILQDPDASRIVADLFGILARTRAAGPAPGEYSAGGVGDVRQPGAVESGAAPGGGEPRAD